MALVVARWSFWLGSRIPCPCVLSKPRLPRTQTRAPAYLGHDRKQHCPRPSTQQQYTILSRTRQDCVVQNLALLSPTPNHAPHFRLWTGGLIGRLTHSMMNAYCP